MVAAKRILVKLANICTNNSDHIAVFYSTIKLYLVALSANISESTEQAENNVSKYMDDVYQLFKEWFEKPSAGFEDFFGGKNGKKIKNEIKVYYYNCLHTYKLGAWIINYIC